METTKSLSLLYSGYTCKSCVLLHSGHQALLSSLLALQTRFLLSGIWQFKSCALLPYLCFFWIPVHFLDDQVNSGNNREDKDGGGRGGRKTAYLLWSGDFLLLYTIGSVAIFIQMHLGSI